MPMVTQNRRLFYFNSPLGLDVLMVSKFSGTEQISELFQFKLELASEDPNIQTEDLLGKNVTVGIRHRDGVSFRYFNGQISRFAPSRHEGRLSYYSAEMVPWVWFLTLSNGCHIYQDKTVPQVIEDQFSKFGFRNYDTGGIKEIHKPWENCVQYMESSWNFVTRLMEMEGIYYYFKHEEGKHTLMLVDNMAALLPCPYQSAVRYEHQLGTGLFRTDDTILSADMRKVVKPNVYENNDYNFRIPTNKLKDWQHVQRDTGLDIDVSRRFYPANVEWPGEPQDYAKLRIEEQEHDHTASEGTSNVRAMSPGYRFDLTDHDRSEQNINYLIVKVTHNGTEGTFLPGSDQQEATYKNEFVAHPSSITFRPKIKTEEPRIDSLHTAFVVGPPGEEIYTDEYGRVRVKFFWDLSPGDDNGASSCWIRVMQPWAGPGFGHIWTPRVGMEVVVAFLDGDPDRPLITGCVYHAKNMPPYPLPPNKDWSGVKTRSTKGGSDDNYNEIRLVDTIGSELFRMQAERDLHIFIKNDRGELVLNDRFLQVNNDKHERIKNDKYTDVENNFQEHVSADSKVKIDADSTLYVGGSQTEEVTGDKDMTVHGHFSEKIEGKTSIHNNDDFDQKVDGTGKLTTGSDLHVKSNGQLIIEATSGLTIKCGGGFLTIQGGVITVQGMQILLNCGGFAESAEEADPDDPNTPEDFTNPDDARFTSPSEDYALPGDETDTGDPDAGDTGEDPDSADTSSDDDESSQDEGEGEDSEDAELDDESGDDSSASSASSGSSGGGSSLSSNPWVVQDQPSTTDKAVNYAGQKVSGAQQFVANRLQDMSDAQSAIGDALKSVSPSSTVGNALDTASKGIAGVEHSASQEMGDIAQKTSDATALPDKSGSSG